MENNNVIVEQSPVVKKHSRRKSTKPKKTEPVVKQPQIEIEVDEEPIVIEESKPETPKEQEIKHFYNEITGKFTAEKKTDGKTEKLEMFMPEILPVEYCMLVKKFMSVNNGVSIGKYSVGTHATVSYGDIDKIADNSIICGHCYNIVSECGVETLEKVISKIKYGGKLFVVDNNTDLTSTVSKLKLNTRFCGYGFKLFNHKYWHDHKNISIALILK